MDISAFSEESFDPKEWINKTFRSTEAQDNREAFLSSLVAKLQLYVQQVNGAVEETSEHVIQSLPRVMHDSDMILKEALMLKEKMQSVKEEIMKIERDTAASMATLEKLDKMKTELQTAKKALHEADNWTVLATDIEEVFESHKIDAIAEKVISMEHSLPALANSGDFEERKIQLEGFKNRLEAMASPHLVNAFTNKNIDESVRYVKMFQGMDRLPQLLKYYSRCEKNTLCLLWMSGVETEPERGVQDRLSHFYRELLKYHQEQTKWCNTVFGKSEMMSSILGEALGSLVPEIVKAIDMGLKQQEDQLSLLLGLRRTSDRFLQDLRAAIQREGESSSPERWHEVVRSVYSVYKPWVSSYGRLEERSLPVATLADSSLARSRQALATAIRESLQRCEAFTGSLGLPGLISAVQFCILKHLEQYENLLREIEIEKQSKDEWAIFQTCLNLLQNTNELQNTLDELDRELIQAIIKSLRKEKENEVNMESILLTSQAAEQYNSFVTSFNEGDKRTVLDKVERKVEKLRDRLTGVTLDVMFCPVRAQLARASWGSQTGLSHQLPHYSYAPLEYITQIGEYLMTLPQHLEPFLKEDCGSATDQLLARVCRQTCTSLADLVLSAKHVSPNTAMQIAVDIGYLGNVLEDLGQTLPEPLSQIATLLKLPADSYQAGSAGCSARLVAAIREIRNITSS